MSPSSSNHSCIHILPSCSEGPSEPMSRMRNPWIMDPISGSETLTPGAVSRVTRKTTGSETPACTRSTLEESSTGGRSSSVVPLSPPRCLSRCRNTPERPAEEKRGRPREWFVRTTSSAAQICASCSLPSFWPVVFLALGLHEFLGVYFYVRNLQRLSYQSLVGLFHPFLVKILPDLVLHRVQGRCARFTP